MQNKEFKEIRRFPNTDQEIEKYKPKILNNFRLFYIKNLRYRLYRLKAYLKHLHRLSSGYKLGTEFKNDFSTTEMDLSMSIMRQNIDKYFKSSTNHKKEIFENFINNLKIDNE